MRHAFFLVIILFLFTHNFSLAQSGCESLPETWKNEKQAIEALRKAQFKHTESLQFGSNKFYKKAAYLICEGNRGYIIIFRKKNEYIIHQNVPIQVWEFLKNARSPVGYYRFYIEKRFKLNVQ